MFQVEPTDIRAPVGVKALEGGDRVNVEGQILYPRFQGSTDV